MMEHIPLEKWSSHFFETFILRPSSNGAENSEGKTENSQVNQKTEVHETEALLSAHEREQVNFGRKKKSERGL